MTLRGVNRITKKLAGGGTAVYHYHRATNSRLPGQPGSPEFLKAFQVADAKVRTAGSNLKCFGSLVSDYCRSADFARKAISTQKEYVRLLKNAEIEFGPMPMAALDDPDVRRDFLEWRDRVAHRSGVREADNRLTVVSAMLSWAAERRMIKLNPVFGFKRVYKSDRADLIWLPADINAFMAVAKAELRMALSLALFTGQRQGDLLRLRWDQYDGARLTLKQGKTGKSVVIPCAQQLRKFLDANRRESLTILCTSTGNPWKKRYFASEWKAASDAAGIDKLHFHDLRGTAITMLAEAGATVPQIASITGHSLKTVTTILEVYLSRTTELAEAAISKLDAMNFWDFANHLQTELSLQSDDTPK